MGQNGRLGLSVSGRVPALLYTTHSSVLTSFVCFMAWCHIRELLWNWLDTQSKLEVVAVRKDSWLPGGLDFGTAEILYLLYVLHLGEEDHINYESISWYLPSPSESTAGFQSASQCLCQNGTKRLEEEFTPHVLKSSVTRELSRSSTSRVVHPSKLGSVSLSVDPELGKTFKMDCTLPVSRVLI